MRYILIGLTAVFIANAGLAQDRAGIAQTIQSQIDAFLTDDFATAFTFASPNIQRMFGTPDQFGRMVQQGYPMVWRPSDVKFLDAQERGETVLQKVQVHDANNVPYVLEYAMIYDGERWLINGVQLLTAPPVGA